MKTLLAHFCSFREIADFTYMPFNFVKDTSNFVLQFKKCYWLVAIDERRRKLHRSQKLHYHLYIIYIIYYNVHHSQLLNCQLKFRNKPSLIVDVLLSHEQHVDYLLHESDCFVFTNPFQWKHLIAKGTFSNKIK